MTVVPEEAAAAAAERAQEPDSAPVRDLGVGPAEGRAKGEVARSPPVVAGVTLAPREVPPAPAAQGPLSPPPEERSGQARLPRLTQAPVAPEPRAAVEESSGSRLRRQPVKRAGAGETGYPRDAKSGRCSPTSSRRAAHPTTPRPSLHSAPGLDPPRPGRPSRAPGRLRKSHDPPRRVSIHPVPLRGPESCPHPPGPSHNPRRGTAWGWSTACVVFHGLLGLRYRDWGRETEGVPSKGIPGVCKVPLILSGRSSSPGFFYEVDGEVFVSDFLLNKSMTLHCD